MKKQEQKEITITRALSQLKEISEWFDSQENIDIDLAISKIKEGVKLVKICKEKLKVAENTFTELKKELKSLE